MRATWTIAVLIILASAAAYFVMRQPDVGRGRFFADQSYHFQTLRVLSDVPFDGADTSEVLETVKYIRSGDAQGWYRAWTETGDRVARRAAETDDAISKGRALLRAHTYYRTAEFFLPTDDPKRLPSARKNIAAFYAGLDAIGVAYERMPVPFGPGHHLDAVFYPAEPHNAGRPLIVFVGGYDSTLEELYFVLVKAARDRGYDVLTYEGPGQGQVLREQGLTFTPEWEKPTSAVLDLFLSTHTRPAKMVLVGMSMGGYLAPRAAAFDPRFDGVVAYDVLFDMGAVAKRYVPDTVFWMRDHGLGAVVDLLIRANTAWSPGFAWATQNAMWTLGLKHPLEAVTELQKYTLAGVAQRIKGDVLILAGAEDHFVPLEQVQQFEQALTGARSVTSHVYDRASGGAEHCQLGAHTLWQADFFDWMSAKFGSTG